MAHHSSIVYTYGASFKPFPSFLFALVVFQQAFLLEGSYLGLWRRILTCCSTVLRNALGAMRQKGALLRFSETHGLTNAQTRSNTVFSAWMLEAVAMGSDTQDDHESNDDSDVMLNQIDLEWPPNPIGKIDEEWPPADPWSEVDDLPPPPTPGRKRRASSTYDDLIATSTPLAGPHRHCAAKCAHKIETEGRSPAMPITVPSFDASTLPVAHSTYGTKVEDKGEKTAWPLVDSTGHIFAVLAGQPDSGEYRVGRTVLLCSVP
ncbi:hypothetical protein C8R44DRAFT_751451 [Mycena epipterygia]|nr:hypothetical protein C8R44DRAFT_751451 [Mycena epipterygia]